MGNRTLTAAALFALAMPALEAGEPEQWLEVRSRHFTVVSNAGEEQVRRVSLEFERVRALLRLTLTKARLDPRQPAGVLAVNGERSLRELLPQFWGRKGPRPVAGSVVQGSRGRIAASLGLDIVVTERVPASADRRLATLFERHASCLRWLRGRRATFAQGRW